MSGPLELARTLAELDAQATTGPWIAVDCGERPVNEKNPPEAATVAWVESWCVGVPTPGYPGGNYRDTDYGTRETDAKLIAALRSNLPALIDALTVATAAAERFAVTSEIARNRMNDQSWIEWRAAGLRASLKATSAKP